MLHIKTVNRYTIPQYPQGTYYMKPPPAMTALSRMAATSAVMLLVLEACGGNGVTGPPPLPPEMVTESEARAVIHQVFTDNGVSLTADVIKRFEQAPGDTVDLELDGYNDSLEVGYEYIFETDYSVFTPQVVASIDSAAAASGPYITTIHWIAKENAYQTYLRTIVQEFIDSLKAQGVI